MFQIRISSQTRQIIHAMENVGMGVFIQVDTPAAVELEVYTQSVAREEDFFFCLDMEEHDTPVPIIQLPTPIQALQRVNLCSKTENRPIMSTIFSPFAVQVVELEPGVFYISQ